MHDTLIVGAGPGGLEAARRLARDGFDVVVCEEHPVSGEPVHCTGVLGTEAFDEFDIPRTVILNPLSTARFFSPSGLTVEHTTATVEAVVVDRLALDQELFEAARATGARILLNCRVSGLNVTPTHVEATLQDGTRVRARSCILACGAQYRFQRELGLGLPGVFLQSAQLELPAGRLGDVEVRFGRDVAPGGFAWTVPVKRSHGTFARVGLMCEDHADRRFRALVQTVRDRWQLDVPADPASMPAPRLKMLPLAPVTRTYGDRVLAVGDAAGLVKATTGGGIYYSLISARLASNVLAGALRTDRLHARALRGYETAWRARLGAELKAQLRLRRLAQRLSDPDIEALFELAHTDGIMPIVRKTARFNQHRDLIVSLLRHPPARRVLMRRISGTDRAAVPPVLEVESGN
ncbi:MAG TPA: NAD(P)/FAD-dependent oxidoreductase [Vicinamibacterales bacterium]